MGKISIHNMDLDELNELEFEEKFKKRTKNGKFKENHNEDGIHKSQRMPSPRGKSDNNINR